jgi:hypothetical protein
VHIEIYVTCYGEILKNMHSLDILTSTAIWWGRDENGVQGTRRKDRGGWDFR